MYIATLFIIAKTWEQPRCSSVSELINRGASQTVEYYSAPKGNELWSVEETWRNLKILKWKKSVWKSCMLYDSSNITFLKRQYYGDSIKIMQLAFPLHLEHSVTSQGRCKSGALKSMLHYVYERSTSAYHFQVTWRINWTPRMFVVLTAW